MEAKNEASISTMCQKVSNCVERRERAKNEAKTAKGVEKCRIVSCLI
jgi:hypothetical protein